MFGTFFTAAPYLYCAWDFFKPGPASLSGKAISTLLLSGLNKTAWGSTAVSSEFIRTNLEVAEKYGKKDLESATKLQFSPLLAPVEYGQTLLTIAARKVYFFINGQAISQTLCQRTAATIAHLASKKKLSTDQTYLGTFEEKVEKIFKERSKELKAPTLSQSQLTAFSAQLAVETALPWIMRAYIAYSFATTISFDLPYIPTLLTVGYLWASTNRLIPGIRNELINLKAPKESKTIRLLNEETIEAIETSATQLFKLDKEVKADKSKLHAFKEAIEDLEDKTEINNPFYPLKSTAPSIKKEEEPKASRKGWFSSLVNFVWRTDKKAETEKKKVTLATKFKDLQKQRDKTPEGTPERLRLTAQIREVKRARAELFMGEDKDAPKIICTSWIEQIENDIKALKLENGDIKAYLSKQMNEINTKIQEASQKENFELCTKLKKDVKGYVSRLLETEQSADLVDSPVKTKKITPKTTPRKTSSQTPSTSVKQALDDAAGVLSPDDKPEVAKKLDFDLKEGAVSSDEASGSEASAAEEVSGTESS